MSTVDNWPWACFHGFKHKIIKLANQNNVNYVRPRFGDTPLHQACKRGWLDIVKMLIEKYRCDPNVVTKDRLSVLHFACKYGHIDIVTLLIENYGCDPNVVTESNESLLHYACRYASHIDVVTLLIEKYGCDPNVVTLLIEKYGCDPNVVTKNNESLLHYACLYGHIDVVTLLIEKYGCDPNVVTDSNQSILHYACKGGFYVVKYLINKQHLNPLTRDNISQLEPLDYAINNNQYYIALYICQHCISSEEMLNSSRIKTTINLIKYIILRANTHVRSNEDPVWKTADGDNILQLVGNSKACIAHIPSEVVSEILNSHNANCIIAYFEPDLRTADGDTIVQVVCQSRRIISQISSKVLRKWLSDSTDLMKIVILGGSTADGDNLLELICQSEKCLIQICFQVFLKWLRTTVLRSVTIAIPDCMTADGHT